MTNHTTPMLLNDEVNYFQQVYGPTQDELARLRNAAKRNSKRLSTFFTDLYDQVVPAGTIRDWLDLYKIV